jgi:hypothetical protein
MDAATHSGLVQIVAVMSHRGPGIHRCRSDLCLTALSMVHTDATDNLIGLFSCWMRAAWRMWRWPCGAPPASKLGW